MDSKIELLTVEDKALVERGKKHILSTAKLIYRDSKQSVVAPCVAGHDGRVAVGTGPVGLKNLALERVLKVDQFGLVEF